MPDALPFLKGTLDVLVLKALAWGQMHGFELTRWLSDHSAKSIELDEAAIYQSLYRLEARGLVEAEWDISEKGRRSRYYSLTAAGRKTLRAEADQWRRFAGVVSEILDAEPRKA
jgi:PadR family transcriptional regulator PadR